MSLSWIDDELADIKERGLFRRLRELTTCQGPVIRVEGKELINFASNDYLGLAGDRRLIRAAQAAAMRWGAGSGSARLIAGNLSIFSKLERELASFMGCEAALVFTSGYHANIGIIPALAGRGDAVFSDRLNHASIIDGCRLSRAEVKIYEHADPEHLDRLLREAEAAPRKLVVTETVFSMEGDLAPLPELLETARKHRAMFMVDEAHALGVLGARGRGALEHFGIPAGEVDVIMGTLGKSLGASGAFAAGSEKLITWLVNRARTFIFTTGPAPAAAAAAREALRIVEEEPWRREKVLRLADRVKEAVRGMELSGGRGAQISDKVNAAIVPVILGEPERALNAAERLLDAGIFAPAIRPPTVPEGTSRLRINISAAHKEEHVDKLMSALKDALK